MKVKKKIIYDHVGRPSNEEIQSRKRKQLVKIFIVFILLLIFCGIFIFNNIEDFYINNIMGNSSTKTFKFMPDTLNANGNFYYKNNDSIINNLYRDSFGSSNYRRYVSSGYEKYRILVYVKNSKGKYVRYKIYKATSVLQISNKYNNEKILLKLIMKKNDSNKTTYSFAYLNVKSNIKWIANVGEVKKVKKCNGRNIYFAYKDGVTYINGILIVNKTYSLPSTFIPKNSSNKYQLDGTTFNAFNEMLSKIKEEKDVGLTINSAFRSYSFQQNIYNNRVNKNGKAEADKYVARAGHSEHQSGLAIDIKNVGYGSNKTVHGNWLDKNAYKYGFILRYPEGTEKITGYNYESWHFRYVGKYLAKELYNGGNWITLEKYFCIDSKYQ